MTENNNTNIAKSNDGLVAAFKRNPLVHVLMAFMFVFSGLIVNGLQALTMVFWWTGNVDLYRKLNIRLAYLHWSLIAFLSEWWACLEVTVYMKPEEIKYYGKESAIIILNHKYDMDWVIGWVMGDRFEILGNAKCMAKKSLSYLPLIGWAWRFCEYIFLTRSLETDNKTLLDALKNLANLKNPFWMLIFCEGTRFTPKKHKLSMEVAEKKGLQPLKHHLLPRVGGFRILTKGLRNSVKNVYDATICVQDRKNPTLMDLLRGDSFKVEFLVRRIPIEEIPEDDEECAAYLYDMYEKKDAYFDYCLNNNTYPTSGEDADERLKGMEPVPVFRRMECLWIAIGWSCLLLSPLFYYIYSLIIAGSWFKIIAMAAVLGFVSFGFQKIMQQGDVSNSSSSYGSDKKSK